MSDSNLCLVVLGKTFRSLIVIVVDFAFNETTIVDQKLHEVSRRCKAVDKTLNDSEHEVFGVQPAICPGFGQRSVGPAFGTMQQP